MEKGKAMGLEEINRLSCESCGAAIDRATMKCPYCGTQYERKNRGVEVRYLVDRPGIHRLRAEVRIDRAAMGPEGSARYALDRLRQEVADGLLAYMKITASEDHDFCGRCQIIRGEIRVIDPTFTY